MDAYKAFVDTFDAMDYKLISDYRVMILACVAYTVSMYGVKFILGTETKEEAKQMEKNPTIVKRLIKAASVLHNLILFVWSIAMFFGISFAAYERYQNYGAFHGLVCARDPQPLKGAISFWMFVFHLSKYYEFVDTVILVFSRKPLIILHIFHHAIMVYLTWYWLFDNWLTGSWYCVFINSFVHTFMYFYYMLTALGYKPEWKQMLTTGQIVQLMSGFVLVSIWLFKCQEWGCCTGYWAGFISNASNGLLIFLFIRFYFFTYSGEKKEQGGEDKKKQ